MKRKRSIRLFLGVSIPLVLVIFLYWGLRWCARDVVDVTQDAYAMEWAGGLLVEYMRNYDNQWPAGWDDLAEVHGTHAERVGGGMPLEDIAARVEVDWDFRPAEYLATQNQTKDSRGDLKVVRLRSGRDVHWQGYEPNAKIQEYLESTHKCDTE